MLEYKVMEVKNSKEAEEVMNLLSASGWRVIDTLFYHNMLIRIVITFEREKK